MLPFTAEVLFAQFETYNLAIWPAQIAAFAAGLLALGLIFRPVRAGLPPHLATRAIGAALAGLWLWTGAAYHWATFATINFTAPVFAAFFVAEAALLVWLLVIRAGCVFSFRGDVAGWTGLALAGLALALYPLLAALAGHGWPQAAMFGVAPAPTVIFTLGILLLAEGRGVARALMAIPLLWAATGAGMAWVLGIPEDASLALAGIAALAVEIAKMMRAS